jgi:hypothetical protein
MFDPTSRYYTIETSTTTIITGDSDVREVRYVKRRFIPSSEGMTTLVEHKVAQGERLDNITARYLGDPTQFWRVADANNVLRPEELTEEIGALIKIALPHL